MTTEIEDWADRLYLPYGVVAHIRPFTDSSMFPYAPALCGRSPQYGDPWLGTGSQDERDQAYRLPICIRCAERANGRSA